ncbi:MAG: hypothetical protein ACRCXT_23860 [Paraclostridium sp.]
MKLRTYIIVFILIVLSIIEVEFKNTYYIFTLLMCYVGLFIGLNRNKINKFL